MEWHVSRARVMALEVVQHMGLLERARVVRHIQVHCVTLVLRMQSGMAVRVICVRMEVLQRVERRMGRQEDVHVLRLRTLVLHAVQQVKQGTRVRRVHQDKYRVLHENIVLYRLEPRLQQHLEPQLIFYVALAAVENTFQGELITVYNVQQGHIVQVESLHQL
jgi:hypothetical protein